LKVIYTTLFGTQSTDSVDNKTMTKTLQILRSKKSSKLCAASPWYETNWICRVKPEFHYSITTRLVVEFAVTATCRPQAARKLRGSIDLLRARVWLFTAPREY